MVDISLIYRWYIDRHSVNMLTYGIYQPVLEQQMFSIHGDYSFNC